MKRQSPSTWLGQRKAHDRKRDQRLMREGKLHLADVSVARAVKPLWRGSFRLPDQKVLIDDDGFYL